MLISWGETDGITDGPSNDSAFPDVAGADADVLVGTVGDAVAVGAFAALDVFAALAAAFPAFAVNDIFTIVCCNICII